MISMLALRPATTSAALTLKLVASKVNRS